MWVVCIHNPLSACEMSDFDQTAKSHTAPNLNPLVRQLGVAHHEQGTPTKEIILMLIYNNMLLMCVWSQNPSNKASPRS
jgi:hypothetical protein